MLGTRACFANAAGGGKLRDSVRIDSIEAEPEAAEAELEAAEAELEAAEAELEAAEAELEAAEAEPEPGGGVIVDDMRISWAR
jgi:multidrug resistance efflux pump